MIRVGGILLVAGLLLGSLPGGVTAEDPLLLDGDFEANQSGKELRGREEPQGWYESRRDGNEGRLQLKLSTKKIGGNATHKAMIKAHPELNTYLTQRFSASQTGRFLVSYDVYIKEILPDGWHPLRYVHGQSDMCQ